MTCAVNCPAAIQMLIALSSLLCSRSEEDAELSKLRHFFHSYLMLKETCCWQEREEMELKSRKVLRIMQVHDDTIASLTKELEGKQQALLQAESRAMKLDVLLEKSEAQNEVRSRIVFQACACLFSSPVFGSASSSCPTASVRKSHTGKLW